MLFSSLCAAFVFDQSLGETQAVKKVEAFAPLLLILQGKQLVQFLILAQSWECLEKVNFLHADILLSLIRLSYIFLSCEILGHIVRNP